MPQLKQPNVVRQVREALEMTQAELAYRLAVTPQDIERHEREGTLPDDTAALTNLRMLANKVGINVE